MDAKLEATVDAITEKFNPVSVFLYGSRSRTDALEQSDYEVGVLYKRDNKISRSELKEVNVYKDVVIYPFEYEDFIEHKIDTPFPENIYLRELVEAGKTLHGEKVVENLLSPQITTLDILQRVRFDTGFALAAILSKRNGDNTTAAAEFSKSCLFGLRCLIILETRTFPLTYDDIYTEAKKRDLGEYVNVIEHAYAVRKGSPVEEPMLYKNVSLLNKVVKTRILTTFKDKGDRILL